MPEDKKWEIADAADMIVSGFAFKRCGETIQIVNLNKNEPHVMIISPSGKMLESSMDPIEQNDSEDYYELTPYVLASHTKVCTIVWGAFFH